MCSNEIAGPIGLAGCETTAVAVLRWSRATVMTRSPATPRLGLVLWASIAASACIDRYANSANKVRGDFGYDYSCPDSRIGVSARDDLEEGPLSPRPPPPVEASPPPDVATDPERLRVWQENREAQRRRDERFADSLSECGRRVYEATGCGERRFYSCAAHCGGRQGISRSCDEIKVVHTKGTFAADP
jgi:hypothetical protein